MTISWNGGDYFSCRGTAPQHRRRRRVYFQPYRISRWCCQLHLETSFPRRHHIVHLFHLRLYLNRIGGRSHNFVYYLIISCTFSGDINNQKWPARDNTSLETLQGIGFLGVSALLNYITRFTWQWRNCNHCRDDDAMAQLTCKCSLRLLLWCATVS